MKENYECVGIMYVEGADESLALPSKSTAGSSGIDLRADLSREGLEVRKASIQPGEHLLVPTGVRLEIPEGLEGQIRPRSGLALRNGITVLNSPGTIDSDYRGEIKVILINHSKTEFLFSHGDRIAQLVVQYVPAIDYEFRKGLSTSARSEKGFGSSGTK